jgi:Domain of unknown function (DUF4412)
MKLPNFFLRRGLLLTAFALLASLTVSAADTFEGRVHMDVTASRKKEKIGMDYSMKNGKVRMDIQTAQTHGAGMGGIIFDIPGKQMLILMDMGGRKMYMRREIPQVTPQENGTVSAGGHKVSAPVETGRTEVIAGYRATEYKLTSEKGEIIEMWLAKGLGPFMSFGGGNPMMGGRGAGATPPAGWESFAREGGGFPMRVVSHDTNGAETMRMEVTSVDKGSVPDSLFSIDGYSEFSIPGMGR